AGTLPRSPCTVRLTLAGPLRAGGGAAPRALGRAHRSDRPRPAAARPGAGGCEEAARPAARAGRLIPSAGGRPRPAPRPPRGGRGVLAHIRREVGTRHDVYGYDLPAWALHKEGRHAAARAAMTQALALGTDDPLLLRHAAAIGR